MVTIRISILLYVRKCYIIPYPASTSNARSDERSDVCDRVPAADGEYENMSLSHGLYKLNTDLRQNSHEYEEMRLLTTRTTEGNSNISLPIANF